MLISSFYFYTQALKHMHHGWSKGTDANGAKVRDIIVEYS